MFIEWITMKIYTFLFCLILLISCDKATEDAKSTTGKQEKSAKNAVSAPIGKTSAVDANLAAQYCSEGAKHYQKNPQISY